MSMTLSPRTLILITTVLVSLPPSTTRAQETGTIRGRLVWGGATLPDAAPKVKQGDPNVKDAAVCAIKEIPDESYVVDPATKGVANGVAYLVAPQGDISAATRALLATSPEVVVDQNGCRFVPHVVALQKDQTLVFKSSDPVGHNVKYTPMATDNPGNNTMLAAKGRMEVKLKVPERNMVPFECNLHPWMTGWFMVLDHPLFAVTGADGSFEIKDVPVGAQKLIVRQEKAGFVTKGARAGVAIDVKPGMNDLGEFVLTPK